MASVIDFIKAADNGEQVKEAEDLLMPEDPDDQVSAIEAIFNDTLKELGKTPLKKIGDQKTAEEGGDLLEKVSSLQKTAAMQEAAAVVYQDPILSRMADMGEMKKIASLAKNRFPGNEALIEALSLGRKEFQALAAAGLQEQLDAAGQGE